MPNVLLSATRSAAQRTSRALLAILALYALSRIIEVIPISTPSTPIVALEILSALAFALVHGAQQYRLRGILVFAALCLLIGNTIENIGVITGFPYGRHEFLALMGPQLMHVPILLGLAYIGMAYVSWTLARLILGVTGPAPRA
jgi:putative membrane protein